MLQGPAGNGLDQIYSPEQAANGAVNITDAQYDMLHVRVLELTRRCQNTVPSVALPRRLVASWRLCSCGRSNKGYLKSVRQPKQSRHSAHVPASWCMRADDLALDTDSYPTPLCMVRPAE